MIKNHWIITDMDDTMIKHYGKPSESVRNLWNQLSLGKKNLMVVATGQSHVKVIEKFIANSLNFPDYIIANQGTVIYKPNANKMLKVFYLTYEKVLPVLKHFLKIGGEEKYIRVCTLKKVIVFDCEESRAFYRKNPQSNVEFTSNIWEVLRRGKYTKLVLAAPFGVVEKALNFDIASDEVTLISSGETGFGNGNYYRLEISASNKKQAVEFLLTEWCKKNKNVNTLHLLGLGDEISDYGMAEVVLETNYRLNSTGFFTIVNSGSKGNSQLREKLKDKAISMDCVNRLIFVGSVEEDGWIKAVFEWNERLKMFRKLRSYF